MTRHVTKRQLLRQVAQMRKMLEGFEKNGDLLPDPLIVDGQPVSHREIRERLAASIEKHLAAQQALDDVKAQLAQTVDSLATELRAARNDLGEEILAQHGFGNPKREARQQTRRVRRRGER